MTRAIRKKLDIKYEPYVEPPPVKRTCATCLHEEEIPGWYISAKEDPDPYICTWCLRRGKASPGVHMVRDFALYESGHSLAERHTFARLYAAFVLFKLHINQRKRQLDTGKHGDQ